MTDQGTRSRDRHLTLAVLLLLLLGAVCIGFAVWGSQHPWRAVPFRGVPPEAGYIPGPIFIGFGLVEVVHRLRNGPQQPGRHTRSSARNQRQTRVHDDNSGCLGKNR